MGNPPGEGGRPLAFRAQDDRGAAYAAAIERSEAAFAHVRRALGGRARMVNTGAELAAVAAALPPEVSVLLDGVMRIPAGVQPGPDWTPAVVASIAVLAERPETPVRDHCGREHDVLVPAVELSSWLLPPGPETPVPEQGQAFGLYDRMIEALEQDAAGSGLRAVSAVLGSIADLLAEDGDVAGCLRRSGPAATGVATAVQHLEELAVELAGLAARAEAEDRADDDG
jgi:hypothetical protein